MDKFLPLIEQTKERLCPAEGLDNLRRRGNFERDEDSEEDDQSDGDEDDDDEYYSDDNQTFKLSTSKVPFLLQHIFIYLFIIYFFIDPNR